MRKIITPWAANGNRRSLSDRTSDGTVSYDTGYGPQYSGSVNSSGVATPAQRPIDREGLNGLLFDITDNLKEWQQKGISEWFQSSGSVDDPGYNRAAMVRYNNFIYESLVDGNTDVPAGSSKWDLWMSTQELFAKMPYLYQGSVSGVDFSGQRVAGASAQWDFINDSDVQSSPNSPGPWDSRIPSTTTATTAGTLKSRNNGFNGITQIYEDTNAQVRVRGYLSSSSSWSRWRALADSLQVVDLWSTPVAENNTVDWNTITDRGIRNVYGFQGPNAPPVDQVNNQWGTLQVLWPKNWFGLVIQVVTKFDTATTQIYSRVRRPDTGLWSGWIGGDLSNKLDRRGDSISGDLYMAGIGVDTSCSTEIEFQSSIVNAGPFLRANGAGSTEMINVGYNAVNMTVYDSGVVNLRVRPSWMGYTPWDSNNFDPNTRVNVIPGRSQQGYVQNIVGNTLGMGWDGANIQTNVDGVNTGFMWHTGNFQPGNYAAAGANCQWSGGRNQIGPIGNGGVGYEAGAPLWLTGVGSNAGNSTANNIYMNARVIINQGG
ncbi:tail fiber protein [Burkholderia phage Bm1]